jgi:hypothetical protein
MNTTHKFVVVLNEKIAPGVAMNAASHMCLSMVAQATVEQKAAMQFIDYVDADGKVYPSISSLSLIVLTGRASHMKKFIEEAKEKGMITSAFVKTMTGGTYAEQLVNTKAITSDDIEYYGVAAFGSKEVMDTMTKKFSLFK